jgi:S-DNA-T family DNA segregation ATPase FtsK/SpoIIIE
MLYSQGSGIITRVHGPFVSDEEVERVATELRESGEPQYVGALLRDHEPDGGAAAATGARAAGADDADDLFDRAVAIVHRDQKASTSYLQRRLSIGYNRAADLIERMEREGLVSAADAVGRRRILTGGDSDGGEG